MKSDDGILRDLAQWSGAKPDVVAKKLLAAAAADPRVEALVAILAQEEHARLCSKLAFRDMSTRNTTIDLLVVSD